MADVYTGNQIAITLKKVSDDGNNYPLDSSNRRTSESGQPQNTKNNDVTDGDYIAPYPAPSGECTPGPVDGGE